MNQKDKPRTPRRKAAKRSPATTPNYWMGLGSLPMLRHGVELKKDFASQREIIKRIRRTSSGELREYADSATQSLSRVAAPLSFLQHFVPKGNINDPALSAIEVVALQNITQLLDEVETISTASILFGYELALQSPSPTSIKVFQKQQAEFARNVRAKRLAESPREQMLNKAIEMHLGSPSSVSLYKDAGAILGSVNKILAAGGFKKVSQDQIHYRLKKLRTL